MNDSESTHGPSLTTGQIAAGGYGTENSPGPDEPTLPDAQTQNTPGPDEPTLPDAWLDSPAPVESPTPARPTMPGNGSADPSGQGHAQLLEDDELQGILGQWKDIKAEFVDEPQKAVREADALVAELMQRLARTFASEREQLESKWSGGEDVSTEELRLGLRRYHSFFQRLLAA